MTGGYLDPDTEARLDTALAFLDKQGAKIKEMDGREIDWKLDVARIILRANQIERFADILKNRRGDLDPSFARTLDEGNAVDVVALRRAIVDRTTAFKSVQGLFADCDLLLTPTVATPHRPPPRTSSSRWWSTASRSATCGLPGTLTRSPST